MTSVPFPQLTDKLDAGAKRISRGTKQSVPNKQSLDLHDRSRVDQYLFEEVTCSVVDELYPHMHLVARKSGSHVNSLHEQILKGRALKITEDPALHLVWYKKELYMKPIPHCLLSYAFWKEHLIAQSQHVFSSSPQENQPARTRTSLENR